MKRKVLSIVMALALCVGLLPGTARADSVDLSSNQTITTPTALTSGTYGPETGHATITLSGSGTLTIASGTTVTLKNVTVQAGENYSNASTKLNNAGTLKLENVNVVGAGKGLMNTGTAVLTGCCFYNNYSNEKVSAVGGSSITYSNYGGAVCSNNKLILDGCSFTGNTSSGYGGAFGVIGGSAYVNNCVFSDNAANGQACYVISGGSIYMMNSTALKKTTATTNVVDIRGTFEATNNIFIGTFWGTGTRNYEVTSEECLNSTTPTQKGYGYYYPVKESSNATTAGVYATYFNYTDPTSVKMGYKATVSAEITYLVGTNGLAESDKVETYYEGGTRVANYVGASGLPYPTVTFNSNGGSAVASQQIKTSDDKVTAPDPAPTKKGYTFAGWYSDAGLTTSYTFGSTIDESITLYAKWTITNPVTVTFNANGGTGSMAGQQVPSGVATALNAMVGLAGPEHTPTFTGWNTAADGSGAAYADGAEIAVTEDTALYAQWSALQDTSEYTVTDAGNLTVTLKEATVANLQAALASAATTIIVPNALSLTAGMYNGAQNGKTSTAITLNASYGLTVPANNSVTLKNLTIQAGDGYSTTATKLTNSGTLTMENVVVTGNGRGLNNSSGKVAILKNCDICNNTCTSGYGAGINNAGTLILDGCSISRNQNSDNGGGISSVSGTIYANNTVFAGNHAKGTGGAIAYGTIYLLNCSFVNNVRNGSSYNAAAVWVDPDWYVVNCVFANNKYIITSTNAETQEVANKAPKTGTSNLYTAIPTDMTTDTVGATAIYGKDTPDVIASEGRPYGYYAPILDNETTRGGTNTYFYYNDTASVIYMGYGNSNTQLVAVGSPSSNQKATAVTAYMESSSGRAAEYDGKYIIGASAPVLSVTYDANGGTGTMAGQTFTKGSTVTLTANNGSMTRTGYTFSGWKDGSGTAYEDGETTGALDTGIVLYAQWTPNTYTVKLNKQDGTGGNDRVTATYDAAMPSATMPTREGYTFNGYYDAENGGTQYYTNTGASAKSWDKVADATLYAQWTAATYTVTLNANGGTINSGDVTSYTYGVGATLPTDVTKSGCEFGGWYVDSGFAGNAVTTIGTTDTGDKTYYAKWTQMPATVPTITTQPSSLNLTYGYTDGNTLTVAANSIDGHTLSYQWYANATNSTTGGTAISGATSLSYTVPTGGGVGTTYYYCVVTATRTDNSEAASTTSSVATMTVGRADISPTVTMSNYTYGGTVSTPSITGNTGNGTVTYYYNTTNSNSGGTAWSGVTATSLDAGTYYLYATVAETDNYNAATTGAVSFVVSKGTWTQTTASGAATQGSNGTVDLTSCLAAGGSFGSPTTSDGIIDGTPTMSGSTLSFKFTSAAAENATATIAVPVTGATNYENYNITVTVTATPKTAQNISFANATLTKTYGDAAFTNTLFGAQTTVSYSVTDGADVASVNASTGKVTIHKAGTATITASAEASDAYLAASASYTLTVNKATPVVTAPTANTLTYTGEAQALVSAGSATGGELQYKLGADGTYSTSIPTATAAGDYTVYYKVVGGDNYIDVAEASVSVTISAIKVAAPVLPEPGSFTDSKSITITCATDGAAIYYTTDGSAPTSSSTEYTAAFSISATTTVKAIAVKEGCTDSDVASATYTHYTPSYDDSGSSSSSSSSTTTTPSTTATTTNADGSTTRSTSRTTTTRNSDGSTTAKTTETATTTAADGAKTEAKTETSTTTKTTNGTTTATTATTETSTTTAADGAKTETTENKTVSTTTDASGAVSGTGTVSATAVTTAADGTTSTTVTEGVITVSTDEAGTVSTVTDATATTTDSAGNVTVTETVATEAVAKDGSTGETVVDKATEELISADIVISQQALDTAIETEEPIQAPVTIPVSTAAASDASPISVKMPTFESGRLPVPKLPTVELQVTRGGFGAVAFQKLVGGLLRVIKECRMGSVIVPVEGDCELVIVDNSRDFLDVGSDAWYKDSVDFVVSRTIFGGVSPRMFDPDAAMTRGMVAQMLYNFDRSAEAGAGNTFVDVSTGDWYVDAVGWANANGVITGYKVPAETTPWPMGFGPSDALTREQLVTILYRYAAFAGYDTSFASTLADWTDADRVSDYARDAMDWALYNDIIGGIEGALSPTASATRAQVATIMMRFVSNVR